MIPSNIFSSMAKSSNHYEENSSNDNFAEVMRSHKFLHATRWWFTNQEDMHDIHAHVPLKSRSPYCCLRCDRLSIRNVCSVGKMAFQQMPTKASLFFLFNCINTLICDRAYWWDFVFNLSTRTFYGCNSFYCSSLLSQWTASFDQMIKVRCCICKTYVYWIYFIATLFLPHCARSAVHTCALSSLWFYWFVVGVATTNWKSPRVMHSF